MNTITFEMDGDELLDVEFAYDGEWVEFMDAHMYSPGGKERALTESEVDSVLKANWVTTKTAQEMFEALNNEEGW